jgi:hypothetical protein
MRSASHRSIVPPDKRLLSMLAVMSHEHVSRCAAVPRTQCRVRAVSGAVWLGCWWSWSRLCAWCALAAWIVRRRGGHSPRWRPPLCRRDVQLLGQRDRHDAYGFTASCSVLDQV